MQNFLTLLLQQAAIYYSTNSEVTTPWQESNEYTVILLLLLKLKYLQCIYISASAFSLSSAQKWIATQTQQINTKTTAVESVHE